VIHREKMSSVDTAWLRMDRPANLMMIVGVLMFEGKVDYNRLRATIDTRLTSFRRFRQRVVTDESGAWWEDDRHFDIDAHLKRVELPGPAGKDELEAYSAQMVSEPLDPSKPLWQITLIENYRGGSAMLSRIHHCIADGIALVGVMLTLTDATPDTVVEIVPNDDTAEASRSREDDSARGDDETDLWKQIAAPLTAAAIRTIDYSEAAFSRSIGLLAEPEKATNYARCRTTVLRASRASRDARSVSRGASRSISSW
jgi:diacylglycerol O-acyltransferase